MGIVCYMQGGTHGCGTLQVERKLFGNAKFYTKHYINNQLIFASITICSLLYRIAQFFDGGGNTDGFGAFCRYG